MVKQKKNPSQAAISAADVKGRTNGATKQEKGRQSNNQQYGKENMGEK